eukprot:Partr_v1_DN28548_c0_g1_i1_m73081
MTSDFYIISKQYLCKKCNGSFNGCDSRVISKLPRAVRLEFPAHVHAKSAMDIEMADLLCRQVVKRQSFADFSKMHSEADHLRYWRKHQQYLEATLARRTSFSQNSSIHPFGPYEDIEGWRGQTVKPKFLAGLYAQLSLATYSTKNRYMQSIVGDMLKCDHTFKVAAVPMIRNRRIFEAMFTVMNEYNLILGHWMVTSKSLAELHGEFACLRDRYSSRLLSGPKVFFTDNCCADRRYLLQSFPMLKAVSLDGFHLLDRYKISKHHPLYAAFL